MSDPFDDLIAANPMPRSEAAPTDPFEALMAANPKPEAGRLESGGAGLAISRGLINGVPVVGPYILAGANRAAAGIRSLANDTKFSDELRAVEEVSERTAKERPVTTLASELAGGVAGTLPLVAAAPAAFGAGAGGLGARTIASGLSGAALGAADSAVRSDGDGAATLFGAELGGGIGLVSPALGQVVGRGVHALTSRGRSQAVVNEALEGISPGDMDAARALIEHAAGLPGGGVKLSLDEALNAVTNGQANRASQLARVVANSGGEGGRVMGEFYAGRPGAVDAVGRAAFDTIAPPPASPTSVGFDLQAAARASIAQSPEGQALAAAQAAAGPRVTPLQMGEVVQPEIRGVQARALQQRDRQAAVDYERAYNAPERFGVERTVSVERPGEPALVTLDPGAAPPPRFNAPADGGPATIGSLAPQRQPAPVRDPAARSLSRFIAEGGGIGLERGDVKAAGLDRWKQPGVGSLVRTQGGKSIDSYWRPRLIEAGYLPPDVDGGVARNIHDELIGLLQQEQRGQRVYPFDWSGSDERSGFARLRDEHQATASRATADVRAALTDAGIDPRTYDKSVLDRAAAAVMRGDAPDPLSAVERIVMSSREPTPRPTSKMEPTTVREEIPAPRFVQVDPSPAIDSIDRSLVSAKGDIRSALERTRRDAFEARPNPTTGEAEIDGTVRGIHNWRNRLDQDIAQALEVGDGPKVAALQAQRAAIDEQLKRVPEMATADANFVLNSQPLEPFKGNLPLGRIAGQDLRTGRPTMPPEEVAKVLASPSALREALSVATPEARAAIEGRLKTKILDAAAPKRAGELVAPDALRKAMLKHEDVLAQTPAVRETLQRVLSSSEGLARVQASPLGKVADRPDVKAAIETLFPTNPLPGSHGEISSTVGTLARNDPQAARDAVRIYMESVFNEATQEVRGVARQYGGAGFASAVRGNSQQRQNLEAAIRALPNGETLWTGLDRMLTTLEATGYRPTKGSDTYFNQVIGERLKEGKGAIGKAITEVASGAAAGAGVAGVTGGLGGAALGARKAAQEAFRQRRILKDAEAIARILTDPRAETLLQSLARAEPGSRSAEMLSTKLIHLGGRGGASALEARRSTSAAP